MPHGASRREHSSNDTEVALLPTDDGWSTELTVYLPDRPGSLARLARIVAGHDANTTRFLFNRAESPNRVELRVFARRAMRCGACLEELKQEGLLLPPQEEAAAAIPDPEAILTMKVRLVDEPGTLATLAELLAAHNANVIFMQYDSDVARGQVEMSMVAPSAAEAGALLNDMTEANYDFHVEYRGSDPEAYQTIIGLSGVEVFFLRLRDMLPEEHRGDLRRLVQSSDQLQRSLIGFRREGAQSEESLVVSEVFENILELAAMSLRKQGPHFALRSIGPLHLSAGCQLTVLSLPTGGVHYLLDDGEELTMIDTGYGLYYENWQAWISRMGFVPHRIRRIMLTHPDADHAGFAGALEANEGTQVFAHPGVVRVFAEENRAAGSDTKLLTLNAHFTRLVNAFTRAYYPRAVNSFQPAEGEIGGLRRMGRFEAGDICFDVLESLGGHTPGQVFFLAPTEGLLFSGDYLIDFNSLSDHETSRLSVPKYLMMSTNADSRIFGREMAMLQELMLNLDGKLVAHGKKAPIFPGHGDPYHVDEAYAIGAWVKQ